MQNKEIISRSGWFVANKKIVIGQNISLVGLCGLLYFCASSFQYVNPENCVLFLVVGFICGGLTVGGIAYLLLKNKEKIIEKLQINVRNKI